MYNIARLIKAGGERAREALAESWAADVTTNGDVPILGFGDAAVAEITQFSASLLKVARDEGVPLEDEHAKNISLTLDGVTLTGMIDRCYPDAGNVERIVLVRPDAMKSSSPPFKRAKMLAVVQLLAARAHGHHVRHAVVLNQHEKWFPGAVTPPEAAQKRRIKLHETIDSARAKELLAELCSLYRQGVSAPLGCFGDTDKFLVTDRDMACDTFVDFVRDKRYANTSESVIYGGQPDFDEVFPEDSSSVEFFTRFRQLTSINRQYVYLPGTP